MVMKRKKNGFLDFFDLENIKDRYHKKYIRNHLMLVSLYILCKLFSQFRII